MTHYSSYLHHFKEKPHHANYLSAMIALAIIWLSLSPLPELPAVPGGDKTHHLIAYAVLALPTAFAQPKQIWLMGLVYGTLGGGIEIIQPYVNRYGEWLDFIANLSGVCLGSLIGWLCHKLTSR